MLFVNTEGSSFTLIKSVDFKNIFISLIYLEIFAPVHMGHSLLIHSALLPIT
jgi:hypothetical protein